MVIPVPTFLAREQIHVGEKALVDHLDAYSAPRLVEYFDDEPVPASGPTRGRWRRPPGPAAQAAPARRAEKRRRWASRSRPDYTVGEYDIVILSAQQSAGLETVAAPERLPHSRWRDRGARQLPETEHAFLCRPSEPRRADEARFLTCARCRSRTSRRSSCCRSAWAWSTQTVRRTCCLRADAQGRVETTNYRTIKLPPGYRSPRLPAKRRPSSPTSTGRCSTRRWRTRTTRALPPDTPGTCGGAIRVRPIRSSNDELRKLGVFWTERRASRRPPASPEPAS